MGRRRKKWIGLALVGLIVGWVSSRSRRSVADFETSWGPPPAPPASPQKDTPAPPAAPAKDEEAKGHAEEATAKAETAPKPSAAKPTKTSKKPPKDA